MKRWMWISSLTLAVSATMTAPLSAAEPALPVGKQGQSCHLPNYEEPLRCITVNVPVDYAAADGDTISLHVTVAPAFRELAKPDPLFVLAGGPGQAGSDIVYLLERAFKRVRATRDIVFIDQRGTGKSGKLGCDLSQFELLNEAEQDAAFVTCLKQIDAPLQHYHTANAARDLDAVRTALGYAQVNVWGGSYGTRLGQAYARAFPQSMRSLILDSVASPQQILAVWGADAQKSLQAVFDNCDAAPSCKAAFPTLAADFKLLADNVAAGNVQLSFRHPRTTESLAFTLPYNGFAETVRMMLYSADMSARIPFLVTEASKGNWKPFIAQMYAQSDWSADTMAVGLTLAVACAEDMPRLTPDMTASEVGNSFLKGLQVKQWPQWCQHIKVPVIPYVEPTPLDTPALLLSGALDPVTPPHRAEQAMQSMSKAQHIVAKTVGHGLSHLGCSPRLLREFLDAPEQAVDGSCVSEIPLPPFVINVAGPTP